MLIDEGGESLSFQVNLNKCLDCSEPSYIKFRYQTTPGTVLVSYCKPHAKTWVDKWGQDWSIAGNSLTIFPIESENNADNK